MKVAGVVVAVVEDAQPTDRLHEIYDLADRAQEFWAEVAKMVQLCRDAGLGSWKELRAMKPRKLEELTMVAARVLAIREREKAAAAAKAAAVPHIDDYRRAEVARRAQVISRTVGLNPRFDQLMSVAACRAADDQVGRS